MRVRGHINTRASTRQDGQHAPCNGRCIVRDILEAKVIRRVVTSVRIYSRNRSIQFSTIRRGPGNGRVEKSAHPILNCIIAVRIRFTIPTAPYETTPSAPITFLGKPPSVHMMSTTTPTSACLLVRRRRCAACVPDCVGLSV